MSVERCVTKGMPVWGHDDRPHLNYGRFSRTRHFHYAPPTVEIISVIRARRVV